MNARALTAWSAAGLLIVLASNNPVYRGLVMLAAVNVLLASLPRERSLRPLLLAVALAALATALLNPLLSHTGEHLLPGLPGWVPGIGGPLTLESVAYGAGSGIGLAAAVLAVAPLSLSLQPHELVDALPRSLERTGTALAAALNLVPAIGRSFTAVLESQRMRGWRPRGPRSWAEILAPVILTAIEDSIQLAEAMEARGFGSGPRTRYRSRGFGGWDWLVSTASLLALLIFLAGRVSGLAPDWQPYPALNLPVVSPLLVGACLLLLAPVAAWGRGRPAAAGPDRPAPRGKWSGIERAGGSSSVPAAGLAAVSLVGLALFLWPFTGANLPGDSPAIAISLAVVVVLVLLEVGSRALDARGLALLAALAAVDAGLRLAVVSGIGGFSPIFLPILCAGFVFGPSYGFLSGALGLLVSAVATGGLGPWVPYQVFAAGWVGAAAGLFAGRRLWVLAVVGVVSGFGFGALMDVWDWSAYFRGSGDLGWVSGLDPISALGRFAHFYLVTSLAYDSLRAGGNLVMVLLLGGVLVRALTRVRERLGFELLPARPPHPVVPLVAKTGTTAR